MRSANERRGCHRAFWLGMAVLVLPWPLMGQDAHYWSLHYGPTGQLLGGTIVAGVNDLSSAFYNPGALALIEDPRFLLSFDTFQISSVKIPNAAGEGLDLSNTSIRSIPRIIAGDFKFNWLGEDRLAYSVLTRHDAEFRFQTARHQIPPPPSQDGWAALVRLDQRLNEYWAGGTWSHKMGEGLGIGASMYFALRGQRIRSEVIVESVSEEGSDAFVFTDDYSYTHLRVLWKFGVGYRRGSLQLGATVTTPGLGLFGWGSTTLNTARVGTAGDSFLSADVQKNLTPDFRSPFSIAGGASYRWKQSAIHLTTEWFDGSEPFDVLSPRPAPIVGTEETLPLVFTRETDSVLNYGVGLEHTFAAKDFGLYASLFRDNSAWGELSLDMITAWDLTHLRVGFTFGTREVKWALGMGYAWGREDVPRLSDPLNDGSTGDAPRASFQRWNIFVAFAFGSRDGGP